MRAKPLEKECEIDYIAKFRSETVAREIKSLLLENFTQYDFEIDFALGYYWVGVYAGLSDSVIEKLTIFANGAYSVLKKIIST